jgi:hypothetical protein
MNIDATGAAGRRSEALREKARRDAAKRSGQK